MSAERLIRSLYAVIDAREWDRLEGFFGPSIVYRRPGYDAVVGNAALRRFYEFERVIDHGQHELTEVVLGADTAAVFGRFVGVHRNGSALNEEFADFLEFADNRIVRRQSYFFRPAV